MKQDAAPLPPPAPRADAFRSHRARDAALILPMVGLALVGPPVASLFVADVTVFGAPLIAVYLFVVWGALIFCAQRLSRRLSQDEPP